MHFTFNMPHRQAAPPPHSPPALALHPRPRAISAHAHWEALDRVPNDPPDTQDQAPAAAPHALKVNNLPDK